MSHSDKHMKIFIQPKLISRNLNFTFPILPHSLSASLYFMADRLFISNLLGNNYLAIYAAGAQLALVISVFQNALSKGWTPFVFEYLKNHSNTKGFHLKIARLMATAAVVLLVLSCLYSLFIYLVFDYLLPASYGDALIVGYILITSFCFLGFYKVVTPIIWYYKKTKVLSKITLFIFIINILLNSIMIPLYGIVGACLATFCSTFLQFIIILFFSAKALVLNEREIQC